MCKNQECMNAEYCGRFTATPSTRQSYAYFLPQGNKCDYFNPNEKYRVFQILRGDDISQNVSYETQRTLGQLLRSGMK
jgi:hypothetical protein